MASWTCLTLGPVVRLRAGGRACEAGRDGLSEGLALRQFRRRCCRVVRENFRAEASVKWTLASSLVILEPEQNEAENGVSLWSETESWHS